MLYKYFVEKELNLCSAILSYFWFLSFTVVTIKYFESENLGFSTYNVIYVFIYIFVFRR